MKLVLFSALAGILGTGIGGFIGIFLGKKSKRFMSFVLSFAGGVMVSVVCFELVPEANKLSNAYVTALGLALGIALVFSLNFFVDIFESAKLHKIETHSELEDLYHENRLINNEDSSKKSLVKAGFIMVLAVSLHNVPEGMAIGSSGSLDIKLGMVLAILLALHNLPEGMAMAVPLVAGGVSKKKALFMTCLSGSFTVLGAIIGILLGGISDVVSCLSLSVAGGAMLYVTYGEIMPQAILMEKGRLPSMFALLGLIVGFIFSTTLA